jgi:hypothetical protein
MRPYMKNDSGHRASAINGQLRGLFFYPRLHNQYPNASFFGDTRLEVGIASLFSHLKLSFLCRSFKTTFICAGPRREFIASNFA